MKKVVLNVIDFSRANVLPEIVKVRIIIGPFLSIFYVGELVCVEN
jgi:hypothetical protein